MYKVFAFYCGLFAQLTPSYCCLRRAMNANQTTFHANYQLTVTLYQRHTDWVLQNTNDTQTGYCNIPTTHRLGTATYQRHTDWVLQHTNDTQTGFCIIPTLHRGTTLYCVSLVYNDSSEDQIIIIGNCALHAWLVIKSGYINLHIKLKLQ